MSDSYENFYNSHMLQNRVCSVAYTLNQEQPVICTHIGDQPLFYIDEPDIPEEDSALFDPAELGFLADEIKTLKEEMMEMDFSRIYVPEKTMNSYKEFSENLESISKKEEFLLSKAQQKERLEEVIRILGESRLAASYLNTAQKYDVNIEMCEQVEKAFYDRRSGTITLYPHMDIEDQILLVSRELRRHWQHRQGVLINPLMFQPEHAIIVNRAQEADLVVSVIRTAWELQLANIRNVWERVENSPMADLARAYAREAFMDFRTINNGSASAAVFEAWFLSERCRKQDKEIIQTMLADYNGYVFENSASSEQVTAELIAGLGEMPFGKNYLAIHAHVIMDDPIFMEVRERSSANFLWFIKFERSYKETEQVLQSESDLSTHDIRHDLLEAKSQDQQNDNTHTADIIQLFEHSKADEKAEDGRSRLTKTTARGNTGGKSADVIDIKRWSSKR